MFIYLFCIITITLGLLQSLHGIKSIAFLNYYVEYTFKNLQHLEPTDLQIFELQRWKNHIRWITGKDCNSNNGNWNNIWWVNHWHPTNLKVFIFLITIDFLKKGKEKDQLWKFHDCPPPPFFYKYDIKLRGKKKG